MQRLISFAIFIIAVNAIPPYSKQDVKKCLLENLVETEWGFVQSKFEEICFTACLDKNIGWMKQNGNYDESQILSAAKSMEEELRLKNIFNDAIAKCRAGDNSKFMCEVQLCVNLMHQTY